MGRDWYPWGGKSSKKNAGESSAAGKHPPPPPPPPGCMAAVFQLFHSRGFQLPPQTLDDDNPSFTRGLQPPVNSSAAEEVMVGATASETDKNSNTRVGVETGEFTGGRCITAINTKRREGETVKTGEGQSGSDSRTPGLVARLMGLDLLPEGSVSSPRPSDSDLPRRSGRSGPDVSDDGRVLDRFGERRLSVQVRRTKGVSVEVSRHSCSGIGGERRNVRSPSTREATARRRFGVDVTNRVGERRWKERRRDEFLMSRTGDDAKRGVKKVESGSPRARVLEEPRSDMRHSWSNLYTSSRKQQEAIREREQKPAVRNYHNPTKENNVSVGRQARFNKREERSFDVVVVHSTTPLTKQFKKQPEKTPSKSEVCRSTLAPRLFLSRKLQKEAITKGKTHPTKALQHHTNAHAPPLPPPPPPATSPFVVAADTEKDARASTRTTRPTRRARALELGFQEAGTVWTRTKQFLRINYRNLRDIDVIFGMDHPEPCSVVVDLEREEEEVVREIEKEIVDKLVHDTFVGILW